MRRSIPRRPGYRHGMTRSLCLLLALAACRRTAPVEAQPEMATGWREGVAAAHGGAAVVVTAHPEASRAAGQILEGGGNAADAAVAAAIALTLVEPQSSGIGGGGFLLHFDAESRELTAWDGRETAPAATTAELFWADGAPQRFPDVVAGGRSVGTPGLVRMLEQVHRAHGASPWADLVAPSIELSERGFVVTPRLEKMVRGMERQIDPLRKDPTAKAYFYPNGQGLRAGDTLTNPALAATLRALSAGADAFYTGPIAAQIVDAVHGASASQGALTLDDLAAYTPIRGEALCRPYRRFTVCGHGPPSSGGVAVLQLLGLLERFPSDQLDLATADGAHRFVEAARLAMADRNQWVADPAFVPVPVDALLDPAYLAARSALITERRAEVVGAGVIPAPAPVTPPSCPESKDTTHLVVVDATGDAVSLTSSIENAFGSGVMVGGFLLNNQLTDFEIDARTPGGAHPNAAAPCKRPRSSMSPTVVLDEQGQVVMVLGSPGGSRIIQYVARVLVLTLDGGVPLQAAISRPNLAAMGDVVELENDGGSPPWSAELAQGLADRGHTIKQTSLNSGLHGAMWDGASWVGAADPRRDGLVVTPR